MAIHRYYKELNSAVVLVKDLYTRLRFISDIHSNITKDNYWNRFVNVSINPNHDCFKRVQTYENYSSRILNTKSFNIFENDHIISINPMILGTKCERILSPRIFPIHMDGHFPAILSLPVIHQSTSVKIDTWILMNNHQLYSDFLENLFSFTMFKLLVTCITTKPNNFLVENHYFNNKT